MLEENGFSIHVQAWDFQPGGKMQKRISSSERVIAVLSESYLKKVYLQPEWATAFKEYPEGKRRLLLPIKVKECDRTTLLGSIIHIDLVGLDVTIADYYR